MADQAAIKMFRDKFAGIRKAIKYMDTCGEFTFEKMVEVVETLGKYWLGIVKLPSNGP